MKQTRRQELKTNQLSVYLQQVMEAISRNSSYIIGGLVIVVLVLAVGWVTQSNRRAAEQQAWRTYYDIAAGAAAPDEELIGRARQLATEQADNRYLGPRALELQANLCFAAGSRLTGADKRAEKIQLLNDAKIVYEKILAQHSQHPELAARVRMSLASTLETLLILGEGDRETIASLYQKVIDGPASAFQEDAKSRLETLPERTIKLKVVASQPASAPAGNTAATIGPAPVISTAPAK